MRAVWIIQLYKELGRGPLPGRLRPAGAKKVPIESSTENCAETSGMLSPGRSILNKKECQYKNQKKGNAFAYIP
jgi:hypothetical protein